VDWLTIVIQRDAWDSCRRTEDALGDFTKAIELEPDNAVYYHNRGFCLRNLDRYDAAIADYTRAIELDDSDANFFNNRCDHCVTTYSFRKLGF
jgi:tetratricopeptide (TPR) repeat protein